MFVTPSVKSLPFERFKQSSHTAGIPVTVSDVPGSSICVVVFLSCGCSLWCRNSRLLNYSLRIGLTIEKQAADFVSTLLPLRLRCKNLVCCLLS